MEAKEDVRIWQNGFEATQGNVRDRQNRDRDILSLTLRPQDPFEILCKHLTRLLLDIFSYQRRYSCNEWFSPTAFAAGSCSIGSRRAMCRSPHSALLESRFILHKDERLVTMYGGNVCSAKIGRQVSECVRNAHVSLSSCRRPCISERLPVCFETMSGEF
jgi:hypothetical protein